MSQVLSDQVIKGVHVISTGSAEQHREHRYGTWMPRMMWVLTSRSWVELPINVFIIEHRHGLVLFDTGIDPTFVSDPNYISQTIGRYLVRKIFKFHIGPEDSLDKKLKASGFRPSAVQKVIISHLHFDHVGGIAHVPQADLLVSRAEWQQLSEPHPEREWVLREHIEIPSAKWCPIDFVSKPDSIFAPFGGSYDVMGDGSMILLPTPGHSPGSMSMFVQSVGLPPLLLVGDLTYEAELLMRDQVPGTGNAKQLKSSYANVRALKKQLPDLIILPSHDPMASDTLRASNTLGREV